MKMRDRNAANAKVRRFLMKIHFTEKPYTSTLCVRAIKVRGYVDLFITNNIEHVTCLQCKQRLTKRAADARKAGAKKYYPNQKFVLVARAANAKVMRLSSRSEIALKLVLVNP